MTHGRPISAPLFSRLPLREHEVWGATRCVTPRQACPRPNGFGRNLRSKTRWFTGFCNSHQVSHFATFFIDARAEISVAESRLYFYRRTRVRRPRTGGTRSAQIDFLGAFRAGGSFLGRRLPQRAIPVQRVRDSRSSRALRPSPR
jgi:hypothetical protein